MTLTVIAAVAAGRLTTTLGFSSDYFHIVPVIANPVKMLLSFAGSKTDYVIGEETI